MQKSTLSHEDYRDYLFPSNSEMEANRLFIYHSVSKPGVTEALNHILDEYGLAAKLQAAKANGSKVRVLNFGCSEGLFLHDLAEKLEKRGLLEAADLNGIDIKPWRNCDGP